MSFLLHVSFVPFIYGTSAPLRVHRCNHRQYSTIYDYGAITGEVCTSVLCTCTVLRSSPWSVVTGGSSHTDVSGRLRPFPQEAYPETTTPSPCKGGDDTYIQSLYSLQYDTVHRVALCEPTAGNVVQCVERLQGCYYNHCTQHVAFNANATPGAASHCVLGLLYTCTCTCTTSITFCTVVRTLNSTEICIRTCTHSFK